MMAPPTLTVVVRGEPVGQGWVQRSRHGTSYHGNDKVLKPWRAKVRQAALDAAGGAPVITGPVVLDITCTVVKPSSAPKRRITWPITRTSGDWDHLARAISDALSCNKRKDLVGVIRDDSQIVEGTLRKVYPDEGLHALPEPGAVIQLWALS